MGVDFDIWVAADSGKSYMHEERMDLLEIESPRSYARLNILCIPFLAGPRVHKFGIWAQIDYCSNLGRDLYFFVLPEYYCNFGNLLCSM